MAPVAPATKTRMAINVNGGRPDVQPEPFEGVPREGALLERPTIRSDEGSGPDCFWGSTIGEMMRGEV